MTDRISLEIDLGDAPRGRVLVLPVTADDLRAVRSGSGGALPDTAREHVRALTEVGRFAARPNEDLAVPDGAGGSVVLVGRGPRASTDSMRSAAARATALVADGVPWSLAFVAPPSPSELRAAIEGLCLGPYRFGQRKAPATGPRPGACTVLAGRAADAALVRRTRAVCEAVLLTRDLVNMPACDQGPAELADAAVEVAQRHGMKARVWRVDELREQGFGLIDAVGRGSNRTPTMAVIEHRLEGRSPALALVGKGVVFDSGGLGIKPAGSMQLMRKDMGGAGTVIGVLDAIGRTGIDLPLVAVLPSAENAIGPDAFRPGDVLRSRDGLTVEIGHTDAEGRLLLADALAHARELGAARLLDVATLTGAARVALGPNVPALFGTDEDLVARLLERSATNDEPAWRLPLVDAYEEMIDSPWADVNNSSSDRRGGAITAALFLRRFTGDTPWAHVDLYAWEDKDRPGFAKGANGMMVRTLTDVVADLAG